MKKGDENSNPNILNVKKNHSTANCVAQKKARNGKCDLGPDFVAPDGGCWSWLVVIAAGCSNVS